MRVEIKSKIASYDYNSYLMQSNNKAALLHDILILKLNLFTP